MNLYPYQEQARSLTHDAWTRGIKRALVVMPTGTGKTCVFTVIADDVVAAGGRVLVLAHRESLIEQAVEKITAWRPNLRVDIEMADKRVHMDGLYPPDVVVASVQSMCKPSRLERFAPWDFSHVIIDEAHRARAQTYIDILEHFGPAKVLGVTATPDRGDGNALGSVFEECPFIYEIRDAIEQGYLVPIKQKAVIVEGLDLSKVKNLGGDLNEGDLDKLMRQDGHLHKVAEPIVELSAGRPTIVFCVTVEHAQELAKTINGYAGAGKAEALSGETEIEARRRSRARFRAGEFRFLVNCALYTEGFDEPMISCVAVARPTKSRGFYTQMIGRGTRLSPATGKKDLLVLDFEGNAGKHSLVSALDVLDGNKDAEVRARAKELVAANPDMSVLDALNQAASDLADDQRKAAERRAQLEQRVRNGSAVQVGTHKTVVDVDPFTTIGIRPRAGRWGGAPPIRAQLTMLKNMGFAAPPGLDRGQASETVEALIKRKKQGLASYRDATVLIKHGLNPDVSAAEAKRQIAAIAKKKGWPSATGKMPSVETPAAKKRRTG